MDTLRDKNHLEELWASGNAAVEDVVKPQFWRRHDGVFVTGHTGFKGSWLALWLASLGARVVGLRARAAESPSLWALCRSQGGRRPSTIARHPRPGDALAKAIESCAARDRVPPGGAVAGAAVLRRPGRAPTRPTSWARCTCWRRRAARAACARVVIVTSDKCYENRETGAGLPRGRPDGRPRPLQQQQGLRGAGHRGLPRCRSSRGARADRVGARRQRDRRRRLGAGPPRARHRARRGRRQAGAGAQSATPCAPGSTCSSRLPATCCLPSGCSDARPACSRRRWNFGPDEEDARAGGERGCHRSRACGGRRRRWAADAGARTRTRRIS